MILAACALLSACMSGFDAFHRSPFGEVHPPGRLSGGLRIDCISHTLTSGGWVSDLPLGLRSPRLPWLYVPGTSASSVCYRPMSLSSCLLSSFPFWMQWGSSLGYGWVGFRFGHRGISFLDGFEVFLVFASLLVQGQGFPSFGLPVC